MGESRKLMAYDARGIANFLLDYADSKGQSVTIMSLLKILYFAHAWHLAKTGEPLVGQPFEAWRHGPVCRVVYDQFKGSGEAPLRERATALNVARVRFETVAYSTLDEDTSGLLRHVFDYYSQYHPFKLSDLTHEKGSPWDQVWSLASRRAVPGMVISDDLIREWFQQSRRGWGQPALTGAFDDQAARAAGSGPGPHSRRDDTGNH
jgi:uncharacterized phage-associated protein